ncbi:MAG: hypothetical protein VW080_08355 [Flavobacteriaceae bacterium]
METNPRIFNRYQNIEGFNPKSTELGWEEWIQYQFLLTFSEWNEFSEKQLSYSFILNEPIDRSGTNNFIYCTFDPFS